MIDLHSPEFQRDPFPTYRRLRDEAPFYFDPPSRSWFVSRYADVQGILRDTSAFSSRDASFETSLLGADGPMHSARRRCLLDHSRKWHSRWSGKIEEDAVRLLQPRADGVPFDLVEDYAVALSASRLQDMIGVADADIATLRHCSREMLYARGQNDLRATISAACEHAPMEAGTLPAALRATATMEPDVIVEISMLLVVAAVQTTKSLIASAILRLLTSPETREAVKHDDQALSDFIEEVLRFASPVQRIGRRTLQPFERPGLTIPTGAGVILLLGAANRDESVFPQAETFDRSRNPNSHIAFGSASHFCLGAQLAKLKAFHAIRVLLARFPATALSAPQADAVAMDSHPSLWGPTRLLVSLA